MSLRRYIDRMKRSTVVVHRPDDVSVRGVLAGVYRDCIVLECAEALGVDGPTQIDGRAVIPRSDRLWLQEIEVAP
jgi:hypothetical protein